MNWNLNSLAKNDFERVRSIEAHNSIFKHDLISICKNSLPVMPRVDLAFDESIVIEMKFDRKKIFFTVLYRIPASKHSSPEFDAFFNQF